MTSKNAKNEQLIVEWSTLQNQFDAFEKLSLVIKLVAILVTCLFALDIKHPEILLMVNAILWGQDAIWKTFQSRFADRLLKIESELNSESSDAAIQFNTAWEDKHRSTFSLLSEYLTHLVKPTVVYPHFVLLSLACYIVFSS
jgi:hypothetical protein